LEALSRRHLQASDELAAGLGEEESHALCTPLTSHRVCVEATETLLVARLRPSFAPGTSGTGRVMLWLLVFILLQALVFSCPFGCTDYYGKRAWFSVVGYTALTLAVLLQLALLCLPWDAQLEVDGNAWSLHMRMQCRWWCPLSRLCAYSHSGDIGDLKGCEVRQAPQITL
jgi:hypothetical protein